jgi:CheY-like chemotaxis protein
MIRDERQGGMTRTEPPVVHKVLLVDDDDAVREMMTVTLKDKGFEVVAAACVTEALRHITRERFDVLLTDLHMPNAGDGFTVVTAMRHSQPDALTLLVSGYPDVQSAMAAILLEADEIIVKPFEVGGTRRSYPRKTYYPPTYCPAGKGTSRRDPAALYYRCRCRLVGACKTEQGTQPRSA